MLKYRILILTVFTIIYDLIFWYEKAGINFLIFLIIITSALLHYNKQSILNFKTWLIVIVTCYTAMMIIISNSFYSIVAYIFSVLIMTGIIHQPEIRSIYGAILTSLSSFFIFPYNIIIEIQNLRKKSRSFAFSFRVIKLGIIPLFVVFIFHTIYTSANPIYNTYTIDVQDFIYNNLERIFYMFTAERIFFIIGGFILIMGVLYNLNITFFRDAEKRFLNTLRRDKAYKLYSRIHVKSNEPDNRRIKIIKTKTNSLLNEYKTGIILIALVNILLLALNIIDIQFIWLSFDPELVDNMAFYVHEGTYLLILSIIMSILIVLYFFRGNQNFYDKNKFLKYGAYIWLLQNGIMAFSLALRNIYYIQYYYALSYKRIGVMIFIVMVFAGLITMFIKLREKKTLFWLLKVNGIAAFVLLLVISGINWNNRIAEFNLSNPVKDSIDYAYLIELSPQIYPKLEKYSNFMEKEMRFRNGGQTNISNGLTEFHIRKNAYLERIREYSWLSSNLPDQYMLSYYGY